MLKRLKRFFDYLNYRGFMLVASTYLTAASLIGFETLAIIRLRDGVAGGGAAARGGDCGVGGRAAAGGAALVGAATGS